jgi:hypothetical protein
MNKIIRAQIIEYVIVIILAACWVVFLSYITKISAPFADARYYLNMASYGIVDNEHLVAPFAYSPGMPLLAGWLSKMFSMPVQRGFKLIGDFSAIALLVSAFALSKCFVHEFRKALLAPTVVAISAFNVKFPIFFNTLIDIAAYPLMVCFFLAFLKKHYLLSFVICLVGIFFKEFMAIPMFILIVMLARQYQSQRSSQNLAYLLGVILACLTAILLPRLLIPVEMSLQKIDPINNKETLVRLWQYPLDASRGINILFSIMSYWLPTLLMLTKERIKSVWQGLGEMKMYLVIYFGLVLLLTEYGGTNIQIFVSYLVAAQIIVIAKIANEKVHMAETLFMLISVVAYNKIFLQIPFYDVNSAEYLDFYCGFSSRVNISTGIRFMTMSVFIFAGMVLRYYLRKISIAENGST